MKNYKLYPFRFRKMPNGKILLVNDIGDYYLIQKKDFEDFVSGKLSLSSTVGLDLQSKNFITKEYNITDFNRIAHRYRTKKKYLFDSTSLHMFVMTHRCNQACKYCQASTCQHHDNESDMPIEVARKCVDLAFSSPSPYIKIEFQGGEPLLNKDVVFETIQYAKDRNKDSDKELEFVICSNLLEIDSRTLNYLKENQEVQISTSLDGPKYLNDSTRIFPNGSGTYASFVQKLNLLRDQISSDRISALTTITSYNVEKMKEVIDEYINLKFDSVFLRPLNPFGYAEQKWQELAYPVEKFIKYYIEALDYLIEINKKGTFIREEFATIFLYKILTPYSSGFVDIQSPSGLGIAGIIYETNGDVFLSDEARMLAQSKKDKRYCLGNIMNSSRQKIYSNPILKDILLQSTLESLPSCAWCAFQPYCGTDPIKNFVNFGTNLSPKHKDDNCKLYSAIMEKIFSILDSNDEDAVNVLYSWITNISLKELKEGIK